MTVEFLGIDHLGVAVKDLEAATAVYRDVLGFEVSGSEKLEDRGLEVVFVETGNSRIELLGEINTPSEISRFLEKRGEGIHHICVRVKNIEAALEHMQKQGAQVVGEGVQRGAHNHKVAFIHPKTTHGVLLELVEYA